MRGVTLSTVTGVQGVAKVGAIPAAQFSSWTLMPGHAPGSFVFSARVASEDAYWITQRPDTLVLTVGKATWHWRGVALEIGGGSVKATLPSAPEVR